MSDLRELQWAAHQTAMAKGWWKRDMTGAAIVDRPILELLMLAVGELSEAAEEARMHDFDVLEVYRRDPAGKKRPFNEEMDLGAADAKPEGFGIELADTVIRIMDTCEALGIDLTRMVEIKMAFNATRPHRHGGKRA